MARSVLKVSNTLSLPLDYVTWTAGVLAKKRSGKSYWSQVIAEELLRAKAQIVALDPTSAWWGLRSSADGQEAGFSIAVFGGEHGDVKLEAAAGEMIATAIVNEGFSAILDTSLFTVGEEQRFAHEFLATLYRLNKEPLHLFVDEADIFAPQKPFGEEAKTLGAMQNVVRRGGIKGIGCTLITQRPQVLNKDVLSQVDVLTTLRMNHPKDLDAIETWVAVHGDPKLAKDMKASLPSMPVGEGWVWAPAHGIFERIKVRQKTTFDSGRTPKAGERVKPPKVLAAVDIKRLGAKISETAEQVKANDPRALKARIAELEAQVKAKTTTIKIIEKPVISEKQLKRLEKVVKGTVALGDKFLARFDALKDEFQGLDKLVTAALVASAGGVKPLDVAVAIRTPASGVKPLASRGAIAPAQAVKPTPVRRVVAPTTQAEGIGKAELRILGALAWAEAIGQHPSPSTAIAFLAGYTENGHFNNMKGRLRSAGYIEYPSGGTMALTAEGRMVAPPPDVPMTLDGLHAAVRARLKGSLSKLLDPLLDAYPEALTHDTLGERAGYTLNGHFNNMRGKLHTLGLVTYPRGGETRAADILFPSELR